VTMLESAKKKIFLASRLVSTLIGRLNTRGLKEEQTTYQLIRQRVIGIQFTDRDIREAEKKRVIPKKTYKFYLDPTGHVVPVRDKNTKPDVLMFLTFNTFYSLMFGKMSVQEAYRLRLLQTRYLKNEDVQEEQFLRDAGLVLKLMNKIQEEMVTGGRDGTSV